MWMKRSGSRRRISSKIGLVDPVLAQDPYTILNGNEPWSKVLNPPCNRCPDAETTYSYAVRGLSESTLNAPMPRESSSTVRSNSTAPPAAGVTVRCSGNPGRAARALTTAPDEVTRSEEHTSELQSHSDL